MKKELILYGIAGLLTTAVNYLVFLLFVQWLSFGYLTANTAAWCAAVVFAYIANRKYVFRSENRWGREFLLFVLSRAATLLLESGMLYLLVAVLSLPEAISKGVSCLLVIAGNYVLCRQKIFKRRFGAYETDQYHCSLPE